MRRDAHPTVGRIYRPRNPRASPLHQRIRRHAGELHATGFASPRSNCSHCRSNNLAESSAQAELMRSVDSPIVPEAKPENVMVATGNPCRVVFLLFISDLPGPADPRAVPI